MKCPFCKGVVFIRNATQNFGYRQHTFISRIYFYSCNECLNTFTTTEQTDTNLNILYRSYNNVKKCRKLSKLIAIGNNHYFVRILKLKHNNKYLVKLSNFLNKLK